MYKILLKILAAVVLIIFLGLLSLDPILKSFVPEYENKDNCLSKGTLQLICNLQNPEDFAEIPGEDALIISQFAGLAELNEGSIKTGVLSRLDLETKKIQDYEITFIEVKSGNSQLNSKQRHIRDQIKAGLVSWKEVRIK